jgi:hypothetical protein
VGNVCLGWPRERHVSSRDHEWEVFFFFRKVGLFLVVFFFGKVFDAVVFVPLTCEVDRGRES